MCGQNLPIYVNQISKNLIFNRHSPIENQFNRFSDVYIQEVFRI